MSALKCPNPACPFLFNPTQVPPGAVLTCPQCHLQFTLGPNPAAPPPGYGPPPTDPQVDFANESGGPTVTRPSRSSVGVGGYLAVLGGLMLLIGIVAAVFYFTARSKQGLIFRSDTGGSGEIQNADFNFALKKPGEPWVKDQETQNKLGANVVGLTRPDPRAWGAFAVSDYEKRNPSSYELQQRMTDDLLRVFENLPASFDVQPVKWAGHDGLKCEFRGVYLPTGETCYGYCMMLAHQGVGYWYYVWAPEQNVEAVAGEMAGLVAGLRTLDTREDWSERAPQKRVYRGREHKFALTDYARIWETPKLKEPIDEDEKGVMVLEAVLSGKSRGDFAPTADLVVLALDGTDDPMATAREYIEKRYKVFPEISVGEWTGDPAGDPPLGPEDDTIPVTRLKMTYGGGETLRSADKLVVFTAVASGDETIVAEASCSWRERPLWERRLMQVVRSLQAE